MMATEIEKTSSTQKQTQTQTRARSTGSVSTGSGSGTGTFSVDEVALLNQFLSPNSGTSGSGSGSNSGEKNTAVWEVAYTASQSVDGQSSVDGLGGGTLTNTRYRICMTNIELICLLLHMI